MIRELLKRWIYHTGVHWLQGASGMKPHYKAQYSLYLQGPRWYLLRNIRLYIDGYQCTYPGCTMRKTLQVHHTSYAHKGAPGVTGFVNELLSLQTLCDEHHSKDT